MGATIEVKHRMVHDVDRMDVCKHEYQEAISQLTGRKTVNKKDLECLKVLGCQIIDLDEYIKDLGKAYPVTTKGVNAEAENLKDELEYAMNKVKTLDVANGFFVLQNTIRDILRSRNG